jgi:hypothetical protein
MKLDIADRRTGPVDRRREAKEGGALAAARSGGQQHVTRPYDRRSGDVRPAEWVPHLEAALRFIEVREAYRGAMTAAEVEAAILANRSTSQIEIGANSCNTLARVDLAAIRRLIARGSR